MVEEESSGGEFSEDEFDPIEADYANESEPSRIPDEFESHNEKYENIPMMVRLAPEGAEADAEYDVPELNESFEKEEKADLDISLESSRLADMSSDSLMVVRTVDTSFDRDSMESVEQEDEEEKQKSVIESQEGRTIILSPGMALIRYTFTAFFLKFPPLPLSFALSLFTAPREAEREEAGRVSISSSSWLQVGGGLDQRVQRVHVVQEEVNGEEEKKEVGEEPVKPPRLKKLARQQSKQELLRAKGFGQVEKIKSYPATTIFNAIFANILRSV